MTATLFTSIQILVLLNPFAVLSTFLAMTPRWTERERRRLVLRATITVIIAGVTLFFGGSVIFSLFGINIDVFRIGGGVILMVCAISLIWGRAGAADDNGDDPGHDIAVVPIAIPMAVGPGTAAGPTSTAGSAGIVRDGLRKNAAKARNSTTTTPATGQPHSGCP